MKKLIVMLSLGLAVLGFSGASLRRMLPRHRRATAAESGSAVAAATPPADAASAAPTVDKGDTAWMMTATLLVIFMAVPGLALFYGGLVRSKNMLSVLMQVMVVFSLIWRAVGRLWLQPGLRRRGVDHRGPRQDVPCGRHRRFAGRHLHRQT